MDKPEPGKQYRPTGDSKTPSILRSDFWADSEVKNGFAAYVNTAGDPPDAFSTNACRSASREEARVPPSQLR